MKLVVWLVLIPLTYYVTLPPSFQGYVSFPEHAEGVLIMVSDKTRTT